MQIETVFSYGDKVRDKISGFTGTITGYAAYITGCQQVLIQPVVESESKKAESCWMDEGRLELVTPTASLDVKDDNHLGACEAAPAK